MYLERHSELAEDLFLAAPLALLQIALTRELPCETSVAPNTLESFSKIELLTCFSHSSTHHCVADFSEHSQASRTLVRTDEMLGGSERYGCLLNRVQRAAQVASNASLKAELTTSLNGYAKPKVKSLD